MDALRDGLTTSQPVTRHSMHPTVIWDWRRRAVDGFVVVFSSKTEAREGVRKKDVEKLHAKMAIWW